MKALLTTLLFCLTLCVSATVVNIPTPLVDGVLYGDVQGSNYNIAGVHNFSGENLIANTISNNGTFTTDSGLIFTDGSGTMDGNEAIFNFFSGDGGLVTNISASHISSGTFPYSVLPSGVVTNNNASSVTINNNIITLSNIQSAGEMVVGGQLTVGGSVFQVDPIAGVITGIGTHITGLPSTNLVGTITATPTNATVHGDLVASNVFVNSSVQIGTGSLIGNIENATNGNPMGMFSNNTHPGLTLPLSVIPTGVHTNGNVATATFLGGISNNFRYDYSNTSDGSQFQIGTNGRLFGVDPQLTTNRQGSNAVAGTFTPTGYDYTSNGSHYVSGSYNGNGVGLTNVGYNSSNQLWVAVDGNNSNAGTNRNYPLLTINQALITASNLHGAVINVGPGRFGVTDGFLTTNVTLVGTPLWQSVLTNVGSTYAHLIIAGDNACVFGMQVGDGTSDTNGGVTPLIIYKGTNSQIYNNFFYGHEDCILVQRPVNTGTFPIPNPRPNITVIGNKFLFAWDAFINPNSGVGIISFNDWYTYFDPVLTNAGTSMHALNWTAGTNLTAIGNHFYMTNNSTDNTGSCLATSSALCVLTVAGNTFINTNLDSGAGGSLFSLQNGGTLVSLDGVLPFDWLQNGSLQNRSYFTGNGAGLTNVTALHSSPALTKINVSANQFYTNTSGFMQQLTGSETYTTAAATGDAAIQNVVTGLGGTSNNFVGVSTTIAVSLAMSYTNNFVLFITNGGTFCPSNISSGAGNSAAVVSNSIQALTY